MWWLYDAAYENKAEVKPCSSNSLVAKNFDQRNHVVTRCLGACDIAARSFGLCRCESGRPHVRPAASSCCTGSGIKPCSFQRRHVQPFHRSSAQRCENRVHSRQVLHAEQVTRQSHRRRHVLQRGGGACTRSLNDAHAALSRDVVRSSQHHALS